MTLPGGASIPAVFAERLRLAEASGRRAVVLARDGFRPSTILTERAFENAIRVVCAIGGSTNALIHLIAIARRAGVGLTLERFDRIARETPPLVGVKPGGDHTMLDFHRAGGVPRLMHELRRDLDLDVRTVGGRRIRSIVRKVPSPPMQGVIHPVDDPIRADAGIAVLWGNLAPDGAVIKSHAASAHLLEHSGRSVVFGSLGELEARIDDPELPVDENSVLVLAGAGPIGGPGMPEVGQLPIPKKLLARGIRDIVRVSDARMSGTAFGTVVLHVAREAAVGGPLAAVRDGETITLDVEHRRLDLHVTDEELGRRLAARSPEFDEPQTGLLRLHRQHVLQANDGCDFDLWPAPRA